ncbi:MAG: uroporphyrinogen-III C-methyltransferase [Planctomycetota bacterium]|nr:MAG: uroporphyrinogen-III C-methyltransferase [Planctomycetota bacterium]
MPDVTGKVYLVGGGPGDPGLLTVRGRECLARADVVLYDYLVNPLILAHARPKAERVCLGRHGRDRIMPQQEINAHLVRHARAGRTVVRLKGGDPIVFAHAAEETAALVEAGVPYEIVPGITAALAVGSYAGIPLTQGDAASAVALVTGQERRGKPSELNYKALAAFPGTLVFYMGVTTAKDWTAKLIAAGKPADTPAAIVRRCSLPDQVTISCTLARVADEIAERKLRPPALVVVGSVAATQVGRDWFTTRPLFGVRVLVTRAAGQAETLAATLSDLGADVPVQPAIEIGPPDDWQPVDEAIARLEQFDWIVFSSGNGVRAFLGRLFRSRDARALGAVKLAAIGPASAEELARHHLQADVVPDEYRAEALAEALQQEAAAGKRFLLVRASRGREVLAEELTAAGGSVEQVVAYTSRDAQAADELVAEQLRAGEIDWITVTSSAIARSLAQLFGDELRNARLASISPVTSATLGELGYDVAAEASAYTMEGLVDAILHAQREA